MEVLEIEQDKQFEKVITNADLYLRLIGLKLDTKDGDRTFIKRLRYRPYFSLFLIYVIIFDLTSQISWLVGSYINGNSDLIDISFVMPCLAVVLMGFSKSFFFVKNLHHIHKIIATLKQLKHDRPTNTRTKEYEFERKCIQFFCTAEKVTRWISVIGVLSFALMPAVSTAMTFYNTGEIKLFYPFLTDYPFDAYDIRIYPFLYFVEIWSVIAIMGAIIGPDATCYALATFIIIQYHFLKQNIINILPKSRNCELVVANDEYRVKFRKIVKHHKDLLRCAALMEVAYTKTILVNVIFSSILICCNLFNITTNDNIAERGPCAIFFVMVLGQVFLLCYFGDVLMRSTMEVSDAIYECRWYEAEAAIAKELIIVSMRASKPCKLTAYGFSDVNLKTFTKILSTSWSYFALLQTIYNKNKAET